MTPAAAAMLAAAHGGVSTAQDVSIGHVLLQMVVALGIVVGGIWGFSKIMGRTRGRRTGSAGRGRGPAEGLHVLSRQQIGKGKSIAVVQAGGQCFLVGIADSGLTPLGELRPAGPDADSAEAFADVGRGPVVEALAGRDVAVPAPQLVGSARGAVELAPVDLAGIDLSALARTGMAGGGASRPSAPRTGAPGMRAWLDALREATVRR